MDDSGGSIILEKHCNILIEHYDSVLILVTSHNTKNNSTEFHWKSRGNMFANSGAVQAWLTRDIEESRISIHHNNEDEDEDENKNMV